jgi:hypothetical protein
MRLGLSSALAEALHHDPSRLPALRAHHARDWRDTLGALLQVHKLHLAPLDELDGAEWFQHDPHVTRLKRDLEAVFLVRLESSGPVARTPQTDAAAELRAIAKRDLVPEAYEWLARDASYTELREFLTIEGGPDGGFDDLVAICQVGLSGLPKVVLGANYWDEMGRGEPEAVHTELHRRLVDAIDLRALSPAELPVEALERAALNGVLATNRALQPEMIGALGLLEMQAGPRCRRVLTALQRLDAPADAFPFYEEHAVADPRHGKDWLERGVRSLVEARPAWSPRIVRGARWRSDVNRRLFSFLYERCSSDSNRRAA